VGRALKLWAPVAAWMAVIFAASARSLPQGMRPVPDWATHGAAYLILALLTCRALAGGWHSLSLRGVLLAVALCAAYGVIDELHQSFVPGRHSEAGDVAKDLLGGAFGSWLYRYLARSPAPRAERETSP